MNGWTNDWISVKRGTIQDWITVGHLSQLTAGGFLLTGLSCLSFSAAENRVPGDVGVLLGCEGHGQLKAGQRHCSVLGRARWPGIEKGKPLCCVGPHNASWFTDFLSGILSPSFLLHSPHFLFSVLFYFLLNCPLPFTFSREIIVS